MDCFSSSNEILADCLIDPLLFVLQILQDRNVKSGARADRDGSESLTNKVRDLEAKLKGNRAADKKPKDLIRAIGKFYTKKN